MCYQTAHKLTLDTIFGNNNPTIVILDEIHDSLSPVYFNFAKNNLLGTNIPRLGLTATVDRKTVYEINTEEVKKLDLLNSFCPIVYSYTVKQGQEDETSRKVNLFVVQNKLDNYNRNITTGTKNQRWTTTELTQYQYYDKEFKKSLFLPSQNKSREFLIRAAASRRAKLLYELPSKIKLCQEMLSFLLGRTLIFGNSLNSLNDITSNVISSKNSEIENNHILEQFQKNKISVIGSFKMLEQGANLNNLTNIILHSYYGREKSFIQRLGKFLCPYSLNSVEPKSLDMAIPSQVLHFFGEKV